MLAASHGLNDPVSHAGAALYARCFPLTGVSEAYLNLMTQHGDFSGLSFNSVSAFSMAYMLMYKSDVAIPLAERMLEHLTELPVYFVDLQEPRRSNSIRSYTHSALAAICYVLGEVGLDEFTNLFGLQRPQLRDLLISRLQGTYTLVWQGCLESTERATESRTMMTKRSIETRMRAAGFNYEQAYNWAQHEARAILGAGNVGDGAFWVKQTNPD